jgi:hypothetical protein
MLKVVGTSRDSRDMAYLLGLRCPDFSKRSRDSRDKPFIAVHRRVAFPAFCADVCNFRARLFHCRTAPEAENSEKAGMFSASTPDTP